MPFNAKGEWEPEDMSVAPRVAAITAQDSPLMRQARGIGLRVANRRGVLNSSIAAGAATGSAIGAATPIASQEAEQIARMNQQRMTGDQQMGQLRFQADDARARQELEGNQRLEQIRADGEIRERIERESNVSRERAAALDTLTGAFGNYQSAVSNISANPKLKADARSQYLRSARDALSAQMRVLQNVYPGLQLNWGP